MRELFSRLWTIAGVLLTVSTLVSLTQRFSTIELHTFFEGMVAFYRELMAPIYGVVHVPLDACLRWFDLPNPPWSQDVHSLSFLGASLFTKAKRAERVNGEPLPDYAGARGIWGAVAVGYLGLGLLILAVIVPVVAFFPIYAFNHMRWYGRRNLLAHMYAGSGEAGTHVTIGILGWMSVLVTIAFYIMNGILRTTSGG